MLANFFYAHPVGHAIEALHYCLGHHVAEPAREISVALNAATAVELARLCSFVARTYAIEHSLLDPCPDSAERQATIPEQWDWVLDDFRRHQDVQLQMFPGLRDYYRASDRRLRVACGRTTVAADPPGYVPHQQLRLELPQPARATAAARWAAHDGDLAGGRIALMPAGSGPAELYPSRASWLAILGAWAESFPRARVALLGKRARDERTATSLADDDLAALLAHPSRPLDAFDLPLIEELAIVESCDLFLSPTPASASPRWPWTRPGSPSRAAAGSSTSSTASRFAPSCPTPTGIRASPSLRRPRSWTMTAPARRA
jgi:hypothetical protein